MTFVPTFYQLAFPMFPKKILLFSCREILAQEGEGTPIFQVKGWWQEVSLCSVSPYTVGVEGRKKESGLEKQDYFRALAILIKSSFALNSLYLGRLGILVCSISGAQGDNYSSLSDVLLLQRKRRHLQESLFPTISSGMMSTIRLSSRRNREWGRITINGGWVFGCSQCPTVPSNISVYKWCSRPAWVRLWGHSSMSKHGSNPCTMEASI